ncbi:MAG TPA: GNAT family protein [Pseudonocardiaceae bacterium]|jgi:RimJ/RimL family protein N-acetyltransferase|nr:GNAT family protein [Pseudonocardiaceae bacterium]
MPKTDTSHPGGDAMITGMALRFADKPVLTGALVALRPIAVRDVPDIAVAVAEPVSRRLTGTHATFTVEQLTRWAMTRADHDDRLDLTIIERATGRYAGEVVLNDLDPDNQSCSFRIGLAGPEFFGRGLGTEATRLILAHAFEVVGLHRIGLEVYAFNPRARHVYEKVGFVPEGTLRHALNWDGQWWDAHVMSLLAPDWAVHRGHPDS